MKYDLFISHASEDKTSFVDPLVNKLKEVGINVWYDRFELNIGSGLLKNINEGIKSSRYGLVVLSKNFFNKSWPQKELEALFSLDLYDEKILPIYHEIDHRYVLSKFPLLSDKLAIQSSAGIDHIVDQLIHKLNISRAPNPHWNHKEILSFYLNLSGTLLRLQEEKCIDRLHRLAQHHLRLMEIREELSSKILSEEQYEFEFDAKRGKSLSDFEIPPTIYDHDSEFIQRGQVLKAKRLLKKWINGKCTDNENTSLYVELDEFMLMDYWYVYFGIAASDMKIKNMEDFQKAIEIIGNRNR